MVAPDLTDTERAAIIALLRESIFADPFPMSPRVRELRAILAKLEPQAPRPEPYTAPKPAGQYSAVLARMKGPHRG